MALSGKFYNYPIGNSDNPDTYLFGLYCEWSGKQNISGNYTDVTMNVYLSYLNLSASARSDAVVSINGEKVIYSTPPINAANASTWSKKLLKTYTVRVPHNRDGTKSCALSAEWKFNGTCGGVSVGTITITASTTVVLNKIPRSSDITNISDKELGSVCEVTWTPVSSSFKFKLKFVLGDWSYMTDFISPSTTSEYIYTGYVLPLDIANYLPNATKGTMTAYLYTYSGSTQIGSTANKTFTVIVPSSIKPLISSVTTTLVNSNSTIDEWGIAVAGYTRVNVVAEASGSYCSTISSFTISGGYSIICNGTNLDYTGDVISSSGDKTFTVIAKDSRGRSSDSQSATTITFYAYSKPTVSSFAVARSSSDAKKVVVQADWNFSSVNSNNITTATLYYKKSSDMNWTTYGTIAKNTSTTLESDFEETSSYNFKVVVTDSLLNSSQEEGFVSTIEVIMDFRAGGKGLGIGKIAESNNLEIAFDTIFMGNIYIQSIDGTKISLADYIRNIV